MKINSLKAMTIMNYFANELYGINITITIASANKKLPLPYNLSSVLKWKFLTKKNRCLIPKIFTFRIKSQIR